MPRTKRPDEAGKIDHAINRGNNRQEIFHKPEDYEAFLRTLSEKIFWAWLPYFSLLFAKSDRSSERTLAISGKTMGIRWD
ncbi:hypothetical protein Rcae01_03907 [Novipirellula caenicola]|uniref:Uncharacterized protein n=1 Tax=Novipirellula caenicola TaxID=1536901 RepID=A0ABP9VTF4_9BACT